MYDMDLIKDFWSHRETGNQDTTEAAHTVSIPQNIYALEIISLGVSNVDTTDSLKGGYGYQVKNDNIILNTFSGLTANRGSSINVPFILRPFDKLLYTLVAAGNTVDYIIWAWGWTYKQKHQVK